MPRPRHFSVALAAAGLAALGCGGADTSAPTATKPAPTAAPAVAAANQVVVDVPGMTWPSGWPRRVREALDTLPWVEHSTIDANVNTHRVTFGVKDPAQFDLDAVKKALDKVGFPEANLVSGPKGKAEDKKEGT